VDRRKSERVADQLDRHFTRHSDHRLERTLPLTHADIGALVGMGPSARHLDADALAGAVAGLPEPSTVTASFRSVTYLPNP
jgi:23S rRNA (guanine745-N1)-methyltransferase